MFDFINNYFTNELKRLFTVHTSVDSHKTRSSQIFHISKARTLKSGMDALTYGGSKKWNQFYFDFIYNK